MHSTVAGTDGHPGSTGPDAPWPPPDVPSGRSGRVIGGAAALISARLGLNPFWLRMAFVVLALAGGLGIVVYAGLWLILVAGGVDGRRPLRLLGGAVLAIGVAYLLGSGRTGFVDGTPAVVALLIGLALALWRPRDDASPSVRGAVTGAPTVEGDPTIETTPAPLSARPRAPRRPPSVLGQATLGLAVVTAAVGALIDQANGGRLHPEQWLGAAAAVCGAGMLIGIVWGRARWLILPAALLAATGYIGGAAAERGIALQDHGHRYADVYADARGGDTGTHTAVSFGSVDVGIYGAPISAQVRDIDVLVGDVGITVRSEVQPSIDLRWDVAHGSVTIEGVGQHHSGSMHLGPDRAADVLVDVSIWRGDLRLWSEQATPAADGSTDGAATSTVDPATVDPATVDPATGRPGTTTDVAGQPGVAPTIIISDGVRATADGFFLLANGEALIDDGDHVVLGDSATRADGVTEIPTSLGMFLLLPRGILLTPTNEVVDLHAWRTRLATPTPTTATTPTTSTTTPPTTAATASAPTSGVPTARPSPGDRGTPVDVPTTIAGG